MESIRKIHLPALLILLTFLSQFFISKELWIVNSRELPQIPCFNFLPLSFGKTGDIILLLIQFSSLLLLLIKPEQKKYLLLFVIPSLLLLLEDNLRLQPWFFLHVIMISLISFEKELTAQNVRLLLQWIIIAVYFWGGFHKLNVGFAWETFPWFTQPLGIGDDYYLGMYNLNTFEMPERNYIAFIVPAFEIAIAVFLFVPRFRLFGITGSFITHLVSLYAIGPFGHDWNHIVWPWNIEMPLLCLLLFPVKIASGTIPFFQQQKEIIKTKTGIAIVSLFFILPALSTFGYWDKGLSMYLYSGNNDEMEFYVDGFDEKLVNTSMAEHLYLDTHTLATTMRVEYWVIAETGVPMYGANRYHKNVGKYLCDCLTDPQKGGIKLFTRSGFFSRQDTLKIPCKDLK